MGLRATSGPGDSAISEECIKILVEQTKQLKIEIAAQQLWREIERVEKALWTSYLAMPTVDPSNFRYDMKWTCRAELELEMPAMKCRFELLCREVDTQANIVTQLKGQVVRAHNSGASAKE